MKTISGLLASRYMSAGLFIDYGEEHAFSDSLRAIKNQKQFKGDDVLKYPGECDLSGYVNFKALQSVIDNLGFLKHKGCLQQGFFLEFMGIGERYEFL
jgi:SAM-dependent MidA family methyltransferase